MRRREKKDLTNKIHPGKDSVKIYASGHCQFKCFHTGCDQQFKKTTLLLEHIRRSHKKEVINQKVKTDKVAKEIVDVEPNSVDKNVVVDETHKADNFDKENQGYN